MASAAAAVTVWSEQDRAVMRLCVHTTVEEEEEEVDEEHLAVLASKQASFFFFLSSPTYLAS